jgi:hypothetical protein
MAKVFSKSDVASHNKPDSLWIVVDQDVYDLTKFQDEHPGWFTPPHITGTGKCNQASWG